MKKATTTNPYKWNLFNRWLDKPTDQTLNSLVKIGWALGILGVMQFIFGFLSIILAIYSFSLKAPAEPQPIQISFYFFITCYLLVYLAIALLGLFLIPAFNTMRKAKLVVVVAIYSSIILIPSLALVILGKWCIKIAKQSKQNFQSGNYNLATSPEINDLSNEAQEQAEILAEQDFDHNITDKLNSDEDKDIADQSSNS